MNTKMSFIYYCLITFIGTFTQLATQPNMRFMDNDKLIITDNDHLEILNAQENSCLSYINLPKDGVCQSSPHCDLFCSQKEIFVISNTLYNTLWQLDLTNKTWNPIISTKKDAAKYNASIKLYSSPNGQHLVCMGHHGQSNFDYLSSKHKDESFDEIIWCKDTECNLCKKDSIQWEDVNDIQISNDGKTLLILSYKHEPLLIKKDVRYHYHYPIKAHTPITLSIPLDCEKNTHANLSPQGNYILIPSNEFLALYNTQTLKIDYVLRSEKNNHLLVFPWNTKMEQFIYFPSTDECKPAFKWCACHIRYDTCADRLDYIGTPFCNLNTIFSEFSEDESRLLLVTQQLNRFGKNKNISVHVFDFKQRNFIWQTTLDEITIQAAAISSDGSIVALFDQEGKIMAKDLTDKMKD